MDSKTKTAPPRQLRCHLLPQGEKGKYLKSFFEGIDTTTAGDSYNRTWAGLGVFYIKTYKMPEGGEWKPELEFRYDRAFGDRRAVTNSAIVGVAGATFTTPGIAENRDTFGIGAGVSVNLAKNITGNIRYDGAFSGGSKFQPLVPG